MREVRLKLNGLVCEAHLYDSRRNVLAETRIELNGPTNWYELLAKVGDDLKLLEHAPPGLLTEGDDPVIQAEVWQVILCGRPFCPGWGWGFFLPFDETKQKVPVQTCCGFRDLAAAAKAAKCLRHNLGTITEVPNGVFEVFVIDGVYAFLDLHGEVHASFPTREEARGCAGKLEALQMQNVKPQT